MLVIEVAESSLAYDRWTKLRLYAEADVPAYWVVDLYYPLTSTLQSITMNTKTRAAKSRRTGQPVKGKLAPLVACGGPLTVPPLRGVRATSGPGGAPLGPPGRVL